MKRYIENLVLLSFVILGTCQLAAQDSGVIETKTSTVVADAPKSLRPLRFGVKLGVPSILTINAEYLTPLLNNRIALAVDYFSLTREFDGTEVSYDNFEVGSNIYFNPRGKGFYGGLSYMSFSSEGTFLDVEFDNSGEFTGTGKADLDYNTFNVKLGLKTGRTVYFRMEIGYGFGSVPQEVVVRSIDDPSLTSIEEIPDIPGISDSGVLIFNLGIGFGLF